MFNMRKAFRTLFLLLAVCALIGAFFACQEPQEGSRSTSEVTPAAGTEQKKTVLFLGDSIGEAIAGISPLTEREAYGYYGILGNCNELEYYNRAVTGYTAGNLLSYIRRDNDGLTRMRSMIEGADLIHISILGNNFLNSNHNAMMINLARDDLTDIRSRQARATAALDAILAHIRSLNPHAVILLQTLYNPTGPDSPLVPSYARSVLAGMGILPADYHSLMGKMIREINRILTDYLEQHTATNEAGEPIRPYELADVGAAFEEIYRADPVRWEGLFCGDGVHPSNEGHAVIAGVLQRSLASLGFASDKALAHYKRDKVAQLRRLFAHLPNYETVRRSIMAAVDFDSVTRAYFGGTRDATPAYEMIPEPIGETFAGDLTFELTRASAFGTDLLPLFDKAKSEITFRANGDYELRLTGNDMLSHLLSIAIASDPDGIDLEDFVPVSLVEPYIRDIAPDIDPTDLPALFDALARLYGIKIEGIDFTKESVKKVAEGFKARGELIISDPDTFEETLRVTFTGKYRLAVLRDPATGESYRAIYVNNGVGRTESFVRYAYEEETTGDKYVKMMIDVASAVVEGAIYAE